MNGTRWLAFLSVVALSTASVSAAPISEAKIDGNGTLYKFLTAPNSPSQTAILNFSEWNIEHQIVSAWGNDSDNITGQVTGGIGGVAFSEAGALRAAASGLIETSSSPVNPAYITSGSFDVSAIASFTDSATVEGPTPGKSIFLYGSLAVSGELFESLGRYSGLNSGSGYASVFLAGTGFTAVTGTYGENTSPPSHTNIIPLKSVPVVIQMVVGTPHEVKMTLTSRAVGHVQSDVYALPEAGSAKVQVYSDFSNTVTWGGITKITDATTGELLTGWTIRSDSGFDYARPYSVPEPSSLLLIAVATWLPVRSLGRKRRAIARAK